ncbi:MAG: lipoyl domain-containing protein [Azoarcus sp.]|jgi:pyruvate/2-oxoglutarate dehydrogenase complex dihydrolipoamide acyltransferase (E2) component|nr:lipoyl domain-containing protein [Azoarcus sp.]
MSLQEIHLPKFPECWESCGNCGQGEVFVLELLVRPGSRIAREDTILILETGKVALDIPSPFAGVVRAVHVEESEVVEEGVLLATVDVGDR